jgi:hypothetical protein
MRFLEFRHKRSAYKAQPSKSAQRVQKAEGRLLLHPNILNLKQPMKVIVNNLLRG